MNRRMLPESGVVHERNKRNRRRWCKGVKGQEHEPNGVNFSEWKWCRGMSDEQLKAYREKWGVPRNRDAAVCLKCGRFLGFVSEKRKSGGAA